MKFRELVQYFERLEKTTKRLEMFEILAELFRKTGADEIDKIIYLSQGQLLPSFREAEIGMSEKLMIRALAGAAGQEMKKVAAIYKEKGDLGLAAEELLSGSGKSPSVQTIYDGLFQLSRLTGEGSIEKKVALLQDQLRSVSRKEAKYLSRFVAGRLRLGVGDATVLEALALAKVNREFRVELERAFNICSDLGFVARTLLDQGEKGILEMKVRVGYPIRMALCERLSTAEEIIEKTGRCAVEVKYDGFRCQIHKEADQVEIFSRNLERTTSMFPEIVEATRQQFKAQNGIFEGEAVAYDETTGELLPFQVTIQRKRKHRVEEMARECPLRFFAFDLLFADGEDWTRQGYQERRKKLGSLLKEGALMGLSEAIETGDPKELQRFFEAAVERGLEGIVAKRIDAPYSAGARNFNWIKLKRSYKGELSDTIDIVIIGYFAGKGQRAKFGVGTVLGAVYDSDNDQFKTVSKVGSGFTEEELSKLKEMLDAIMTPQPAPRVESLMIPDRWVEPRYVLTVMADEVTRSPSHTAGKIGDGPGYALRFPRTVGFIRPDKRPEDATTVKEIARLFEIQRRVKMK